MSKYTLIGLYNERDLYEDNEIFQLKSMGLGLWNIDTFHPNKLHKEVQEWLSDGNPFVLITHHEDIFNMFGSFIMDGRVNPEDVRVILFDEVGMRMNPHYGGDGFLKDWPYGFFNWGY